MTLPSRSVVRFYNKRGSAEQWINEDKQATHSTRLPCHQFRTKRMRLQLSILAHNLGNLWRMNGVGMEMCRQDATRTKRSNSV